MHIGKWLLIKYEGKILRGVVVKIFQEDLDIKLDAETIVRRKFWEVRNAPFDNEKEEK
jgi:hypothetical protein